MYHEWHYVTGHTHDLQKGETYDFAICCGVGFLGGMVEVTFIL